MKGEVYPDMISNDQISYWVMLVISISEQMKTHRNLSCHVFLLVKEVIKAIDIHNS